MGILEHFAGTVATAEADMVTHVGEYIDWMVGRHEGAFEITDEDDIDLRAYLLHLRVSGTPHDAVRQRVNSLKNFYSWAKASDLITYDPFTSQEFEGPILSRDEIRRRKDRLPKDAREREITQLRALNELAQQLNRSVDVQAALDVSLETLVKVMNLQTAWTFLLPEIYRQVAGVATRPPHDFALAAACGLPPGLEQDKRRFLCQPPDCHCQDLARKGRLKRAVNIVECTRIQDSAKAKGDNRGLYFHASVPLIASDQLLGIINVATTEWQFFTSNDLQFLSIVSAYVTAALERATLFDLARLQRERFEKELEMARQVQASLLPEDLPQIPGFDVVAHWRAAREVGGDFYDVIPLTDGRFGLVVADVSDKGAPAALYMAMVRSLIRADVTQYDGPAKTLMQVNDDIIAHSASDMFVTVFYGVLDPVAGTFTYANAGHDPPLLRRATGQVVWLATTGPLVGIFEDCVLQEEQVDLVDGDVLLLYTDGVTDALNEAGKEYGRARLTSQVATSPATADAILDRIRHDVTSFIGTANQLDDITMLILTRSYPTV